MFHGAGSKPLVGVEKSREVYLPAGCDWHDFRTGERHCGGQTITAAAPLDTIPVFVRAGSILPLGPVLQSTSEKPCEPIELRVYPGADADFTLYEDAGDGYGYETGEFTLTAIHWNDSTGQLTIGPRQASSPECPRNKSSSEAESNPRERPFFPDRGLQSAREAKCPGKAHKSPISRIHRATDHSNSSQRPVGLIEIWIARCHRRQSSGKNARGALLSAYLRCSMFDAQGLPTSPLRVGRCGEEGISQRFVGISGLRCESKRPDPILGGTLPYMARIPSSAKTLA